MVRIGIDSIPIQLMSGIMDVPVCSKAVWDKMAVCDPKEACNMLLGGRTLGIKDTERVLLAETYKTMIKEIRECLKLTIPHYPVEEDEDTVKYNRYTTSDKLVADYANLSIYEVDKISILDYWLLERDAFIGKLSQTEKGREYLNNAYRLTCTEADADLGI